MRVAVIFFIICLVLINIEVSGQRQREGRRRNERNDEMFQGQRQGQPIVRQPRGRWGRNQNNERAQRRRPERGERRRHHNRDHTYRGKPQKREPVLTEQDIVNSVCNYCRATNSTNCNAVCTSDQNLVHHKLITTPLGNTFCSFCDNYRFDRRVFELCRNRFCLSGKK
uniref:Uncharacterized protein LOC111126627 isoform X1 n=1 Tax=Crassostrea virginica TaxID=6565 RepID=A0A8B8DGR4_CRAVI|nr:uncharacterized protein LOC111126627 isoform X1 [Crassostrea virginica]